MKVPTFSKNWIFVLLISGLAAGCATQKRTLMSFATVDAKPVVIIPDIGDVPEKLPVTYLTPVKLSGKECYEKSLDGMVGMLEHQEPMSFKRAVFISENAWYEDSLDYDTYCADIKSIVKTCNAYGKVNDILYKYPDQDLVKKGACIYKFFTDTIKVQIHDKVVPYHFPFTYDFKDYSGIKDWRTMFTTKLLHTNTGNCHGLPFLYKIVSDEMGAGASLSLAPKHIYIKNHDKKDGWYNVELTSATFPTDAWIMTADFIQLEAIQNRIYMDTLSLPQSITICMVDLAKGYERKYGIADGFVLKCANAALKYHPYNINALLLKAETLKKSIEKQMAEAHIKQLPQAAGSAEIKGAYEEMQNTYLRCFDLGYREMPDRMYKIWHNSIGKTKDTYSEEKPKSCNLSANSGNRLREKSGMLTMSNEVYEEFHQDGLFERIGNVVVNTKLKKVSSFLKPDTSEVSMPFEPEVSSTWMSPDPLAYKFPGESPYCFSGNNPISMVDPDGKAKTWYITVIDENGGSTQLKVIEKYTVIQQTKDEIQTIGYGGVQFASISVTNTYTYDVEQHVTIDKRGKGSVSLGEAKATNLRDNFSAVRFVQDNLDQAEAKIGNGGGILFISGEGQGQETRKGGSSVDKKSVEISMLLSMIGAAKSAATSEATSKLLEGVSKMVDAHDIGTAMGEYYGTDNRKTEDSCSYCGAKADHLEYDDHPWGKISTKEKPTE